MEIVSNELKATRFDYTNQALLSLFTVFLQILLNCPKALGSKFECALMTFVLSVVFFASGSSLPISLLATDISNDVYHDLDKWLQQDLEVFADANQMLKKFMIDGSPLYMIIDHLNNVEIL